VIASGTYRLRTLLLAAYGLFASLGFSQATNGWSLDTARIGDLLRKSDAQMQLWHLDSTAYYAGRGLTLVEAMLAETVAAKDTSRKKPLILLKASCLEHLGLSGTTAVNLSQLKESERLFKLHGEESRGLRAEEGIASWYHRNGEYQQAVQWFRKVAQARNAMGDAQGEADVLNTMGTSYRMQGEYGSAIECHLKALRMIEPTGDLQRIGMSHILIGSARDASGSRTEALKHLHLARSCFERGSRSSYIAMAYNDLGAAHLGAGSLDSALYWHQRSAEVRTRDHDDNGIADSFSYIGTIRRKQGRMDTARASYREALAAYGRANNPIGMSSVYGSLADLELEADRSDTALAYLDQALELFKGPGHHQELAPVYFRIARVLETIGDRSGAITAYRKGIGHAVEVSAMRNMMLGHEALCRLHAEQGDFRSAYLAHEKFLVARDSVHSRAGRSRVVQLMMKHDLEQDRILQQAKDEARRDRERAELDDQRSQMYVYLAAGALFLVLALALVARLRFISRVRKRLERQRVDLQLAMERAERSEKFKERFLANMSHEIRTPMNAIMGMSGIMLRNEHLPQQEAQLEAVRSNADRLLRTLNDILDLSKMDAGMMQPESIPLDPRSIMQHVHEAWKPNCDAKRVALLVEVAPEVPASIMGDPTRLEQVISNLVENAIKLTDHGSIHVDVRALAGDADTAQLSFTVRDTGVGLSPARMEGIFTEFHQDYSTARKKRGDIGLGLTISKRLLELMGGTLTMTSVEGHGSTFIATIPLRKAADTSFARGTPRSTEDLRDLHILLAEDNDFNVMVAQDELNDAIPGVVVDVAQNGSIAVTMAQQNTYDVILMDVQMPEMNGYDAAKAIRALDGAVSRIPIIAMTANTMQADLDQCKAAGMDGYIPKPFKREELILALQHALIPERSVRP